MTSIFTLIAFVAGFILACILFALKSVLGKRNRESEIEFLQFEKNHREMIRDSKVHRDRVARRSIFSALLFLGMLILITLMFIVFGTASIFGNSSITFPLLDRGIQYLPFVLWTAYLIYVFVLWRRYANINAHQKFLYKIDAKMVKARKRLEK